MSNLGLEGTSWAGVLILEEEGEEETSPLHMLTQLSTYSSRLRMAHLFWEVLPGLTPKLTVSSPSLCISGASDTSMAHLCLGPHNYFLPISKC